MNRDVASWPIRLDIFGALAAGVALVLALLSVLLSGIGSLAALVKLVALAAPIAGIVILATARYWIAFGLSFLTAVFTVPLPILHRLPLAVMFWGVLFPVVVARIALNKKREVELTGIVPKLMLLVAAIICGRFLYDRPGSVWIGGRGGGGEAVVFVIGAISFFTAHSVVSASGAVNRNAKLAVTTLLAIQMVFIFTAALQGASGSGGIFFYRPTWFIAAFALAAAANRIRERRSPSSIPYYIVGILTLLLAALTPHRSRPLYAAGMILAIAPVYGMTRRTVRFFALLLAALLVGLLLMGQYLPVTMRRSLSTLASSVVGSEFVYEAGEMGISSEHGWQSEFRKMLYQTGFRRIRNHPLVGNGFAFTLEELVFASLGFEDARRAAAALLGTSGTYHNSLLELAVFCGLPVALLFVLAYFMCAFRFLMYGRKLPPGTEKTFCAAILGFFVAQTGQMLLNGAAYDFFAVCVMMGVMHIWPTVRPTRLERAT